ncbi:hypothetical protein [Aliihoeflea sp. 40Bstr573]|uniref:hypothetical protein n=1 Tax=Aliihoeflea sp. 40Bstr573 TaxID=2696467 RepID=UPI0020954D59|nr:hypothetical protein [Aliihoeflea sp. 40Bstr573]MCO6386334.1 hypothetical protein [Aliihoeflea sp. 40Bstr573]
MLSHAARQGYLLRPRCRGCGREALFVARDLMVMYVTDRRIDSVRFHCQQCDGRDHEIRLVHPDELFEREYVVWRPAIVKGKQKA